LNSKETYSAILNGFVAGLTISAVLAVAAYIAYQKINANVTTAEATPLGKILGAL
jgi:CHASE3 domain sensor protein